MADTHTVPRPTQAHNADFELAVVLLTCAGVVVVLFPGAAVGALLFALMWRATKPDILFRWLFAGLGAATLAGLHSSLAIGWPWRGLLHHWLPALASPTPQV